MHILAAGTSPEVDIPNFPVIAGLYSQLAGVLAGFAFAGLIALIVAQITVEAEAPRSLQSYSPMIAAFISLIATSLDYAIVAGDQASMGREAALEPAAGIGFCVAGTMLLYSILTLVRGVQKDVDRGRDVTKRTGDLLRIAIVLGVSPLLTALLYGGVRDSMILQTNSRTAFGWVDVTAMILFAANLLGGGVLFLLFRNKPKAMPKLVSVLCAAAVAITLLSVLSTTLMISFMDKDSFQPMVIPAIEMIILNFFTVGVSYSVIRYDA
jgi:hypothetical protein